MKLRRLDTFRRKREAGFKLTAREDFSLRHSYSKGCRS